MFETGSDAYKLRRFEHKALDVPVYRELVFKSLEPKFQHFLLDQSILDQDELPALGFFENEETWLMATTRRVVWSRPGFRKELSYKHIKSDGMTEMDKLFKEKNPNHEERAKEIARIKGGSPWFFLGRRKRHASRGTTTSRWSTFCHLEPGAIFDEAR